MVNGRVVKMVNDTDYAVFGVTNGTRGNIISSNYNLLVVEFTVPICDGHAVASRRIFVDIKDVKEVSFKGYEYECEDGQECPYNASNIHECKKHCGYDGLDVEEE